MYVSVAARSLVRNSQTHRLGVAGEFARFVRRRPLMTTVIMMITSMTSMMMMAMILVNVDGSGTCCVVGTVVSEQVFADLQNDGSSVIARVVTPLYEHYHYHENCCQHQHTDHRSSYYPRYARSIYRHHHHHHHAKNNRTYTMYACARTFVLPSSLCEQRFVCRTSLLEYTIYTERVLTAHCCFPSALYLLSPAFPDMNRAPHIYLPGLATGV